VLTEAAPRIRARLVVEGVVQGVGFRPHAHRLAAETGVCGFVRNAPAGAELEVEGPREAVDRFLELLGAGGPPLARIDAVRREDIPASGDSGFEIIDSRRAGQPAALIAPDSATCDACLAEISDPADRRYRHPFANCTDCGPRFAVIRSLPYDRPATTMAPFAMCADCAREYADPTDRRYHAQPVCCPNCGPQLEFVAPGGRITGTDAALAAVQAAWARGEIVAVKGLGGYHLTCDARHAAAVELLRRRKARGAKPFALMARDLQSAEVLVELDEATRRALASAARPIVLAPRRRGARVADAVAPGNPDLGVMLPYSGLHHLLLADAGGAQAVPDVIVATSGNLAGEPLCTRDGEAFERLARLADCFLVHDREIAAPCDDSVVRIVDGRELPVRRSRGYAPLPVELPVDVPPTLAVGSELKATFCVANGRRAWLSQHIGDVENLETLEALERGVEAFRLMYDIDPVVLAVDMHPGYLSRAWAGRIADGRRIVEVQHHHAHAVSAMAEHGVGGDERIVAMAFDGTGYGRGAHGGASSWGGEILIAGPMKKALTSPPKMSTKGSLDLRGRSKPMPVFAVTP